MYQNIAKLLTHSSSLKNLHENKPAFALIIFNKNSTDFSMFTSSALKGLFIPESINRKAEA